MAQSKPASQDSVQEARTRARRRLIGAVVLLLIGVIGFPIVFETQPRPIPVDVTIEIPRKENAPPLLAPAPREAPAASAPPGVAPAPKAERVESKAGASAGKAGAPVANAAPSVAPVAKAPPPAAAERAGVPPEPGKLPTAAEAGAAGDAGRFVVQIGAFADAAAAQAVRTRAEKLGLKTYTQRADTPAGSRVRVRIGPFASRAAADQAAEKAKAGGLSAVVLTL